MTKREKILVGIIGALIVTVLVTSDRITTFDNDSMYGIGVIYNVSE